MTDERLLATARGDEPADLVLTGGRVVNVLTAEIDEVDVALSGGRIAGLGRYDGREVIDLEGAFLAPGLIDAHVHVESSMVTPSQYARAVVPRGTTTVIADPHEIANVLGLSGIQLMLDDSADLPLSVFFMAPSCVPATRLETSGAELSAKDLLRLRANPRVIGLAEVMNFPAVAHGDPEVLEKIDAFSDLVVDGHAPLLSGPDLQAYVAAGITSDHECTSADEAREKLQLGMTVFLREGTAAKNLVDLLEVVTEATRDRVCMCTDDRHAAELLDEGHIDHLLRLAIGRGLDPLTALRAATWNPARHFRLWDRGAIVPGLRGDIMAFDDLEAPRPHMVLSNGVVSARNGEMLTADAPRDIPSGDSVHIDWARVNLRVGAQGSRLRVIGLVPDQILTVELVLEARIEHGAAVADTERDILKMAVVERHGRSGNVGLGFVKGIGMRRGAMATSVAHDHHNLVLIGVDDESMLSAGRQISRMGGGMAVSVGEHVLAAVPLPIAGLMSDASLVDVRRQIEAAAAAARDLGCSLKDPFMTMSFLSLEVIPSLKLTDRGLVDVERLELVDLWSD